MKVSTLARRLGVKWPATRNDEKLAKYILKEGPEGILNLTGFGDGKAHAILTVLNAFSENGDLESFEHVPSAVLDVTDSMAADVAGCIEWLELNWEELQVALLESNLSKENIETLALSWGMEWNTGSAVILLQEVVHSKSLSEFKTSRRGFGNKKLNMLAPILRRAWAEIAPNGPAGSMYSTTAEARELDAQEVLAIGIENCIGHALKLANCTKREISIMERRYGLSGFKRMTLAEIGIQDGVTRERIRQLQEHVIRKTGWNQLSKSYLRIVMNSRWQDLCHSLFRKDLQPLLRNDLVQSNRMKGSDQFLVDVLFGNFDKALVEYETQGQVHRVKRGWWFGRQLPSDGQVAAEQCRSRLERSSYPLPLSVLRDCCNYSGEAFEECLGATGIRIRDGFCFLGSLKRPQRRSILAGGIAGRTKKFLWMQTDLHQQATLIDSQLAGSMRILVRDISSVPGIAIDLPGPYIAFNPYSLKEIPALEPPVRQQESIAAPNHIELFDSVADDTLAGGVFELLGQQRIIRYEALEEMFAKKGIGAPQSLAPTLLSKRQFVRYAPGYWGLHGLDLTQSDIHVLCNAEDLTRYVLSLKTGGLIELFPFWGPRMEYQWCRWAEQQENSQLFESLLAVCCPDNWTVNEAIKKQWIDKKQRLSNYWLPPTNWELTKAFIEFKAFYGLVHLVEHRGQIGTATICHFFGMINGDRKAVGSLALLAALGILTPQDNLDETWHKGPQCVVWLEKMSQILTHSTKTLDTTWLPILSRQIENLEDSVRIGRFLAKDLKESYLRWEAEVQ